jgi:hypothetical protein
MENLSQQQSLPFQVQIHFTRLDGAKCVRYLFSFVETFCQSPHKQKASQRHRIPFLDWNSGSVGLSEIEQKKIARFPLLISFFFPL